jgi:hypothetical protein
MFNRASHPYTADLLEAALRVAQFQAMFYKRKFERPRPSQLCPALLPPIEVPGHASFPSGHATEIHLQAHCLALVMPQEVSTPVLTKAGQVIADLPSPPLPAEVDETSTPLLRMAQRVTRNREVLGLHYPSDSEAGKRLAEMTFDILSRSQAFIRDILEEAKKEWLPNRDVPPPA